MIIPPIQNFNSRSIEHLQPMAERDLEIGRQIQAGFLPSSLPDTPGWEIVARFEAARLVAGDFYDVFTLSNAKRIGLVIGDVTDKGVGAALFMALFRSLIRAFASQHISLGWMDVLGSDFSDGAQVGSVRHRRQMLSTGATALKNAIDLTNNYIAQIHGEANMFATVFFGILDPDSGALMYINGGHEPPVILGAGGIKTHLTPTGPAVGMFPDLEFGIEQVKIEPGDVLVAYTDGVTDARDPAGNAYSEARLVSLIQQPMSSATSLLDHLLEELTTHISGADQFDDITLLAVKRLR